MEFVHTIPAHITVIVPVVGQVYAHWTHLLQSVVVWLAKNLRQGMLLGVLDFWIEKFAENVG